MAGNQASAGTAREKAQAPREQLAKTDARLGRELQSSDELHVLASNLILVPDLDSYYVMDVVVVRLYARRMRIVAPVLFALLAMSCHKIGPLGGDAAHGTNAVPSTRHDAVALDVAALCDALSRSGADDPRIDVAAQTRRRSDWLASNLKTAEGRGLAVELAVAAATGQSDAEMLRNAATAHGVASCRDVDWLARRH